MHSLYLAYQYRGSLVQPSRKVAGMRCNVQLLQIRSDSDFKSLCQSLFTELHKSHTTHPFTFITCTHISCPHCTTLGEKNYSTVHRKLTALEISWCICCISILLFPGTFLIIAGLCLLLHNSYYMSERIKRANNDDYKTHCWQVGIKNK